MPGGEPWLGEMSRGAPRADAHQGRVVGASGIRAHDGGITALGLLSLCALFTMSQEVISWGVDVFFSVDFLLPTANLFWAWNLKVKQDLVWKGTKDLEVVMNWLTTTEGEKKKRYFGPRIYFETKGSTVSAVNALGWLARSSALN